MTDLPEQLPDARAVLAAAYWRHERADEFHNIAVDADPDQQWLHFRIAAHQREQARALAAIGAGLATVEAYELAREYSAQATELLDAARRLAAVEQTPAGEPSDGIVAAGQRALSYLPDGPEPSASAVEIGRQFAEQAQPLPPVDDVAGCDAADLGRRCVRLAGHEDGHLFPPTVPAGSDRFA